MAEEEDLTFGKAVDLSVMKWEWREKNPLGTHKELVKVHPELDALPFFCGLCEYYGVIEGTPIHSIIMGKCSVCFLHDGISQLGDMCCVEYYKYLSTMEMGRNDKRWAKHWATKLLNRLYEIQLCCQAQGIK